jgi:hypothetical protein
MTLRHHIRIAAARHANNDIVYLEENGIFYLHKAILAGTGLRIDASGIMHDKLRLQGPERQALPGGRCPDSLWLHRPAPGASHPS